MKYQCLFLLFYISAYAQTYILKISSILSQILPKGSHKQIFLIKNVLMSTKESTSPKTKIELASSSR